MRISTLQREAADAWDLIGEKRNYAAAYQLASLQIQKDFYSAKMKEIDDKLRQFVNLNTLKRDFEIISSLPKVDPENRRYVIRIGGRMIYGGMFNDTLVDALKGSTIPSERAYDPLHHIWVFEYHEGLWYHVIDIVEQNKIDRTVFIADRNVPSAHVVFAKNMVGSSISSVPPHLILTTTGMLTSPPQGVWAARGGRSRRGTTTVNPLTRPSTIIVDDLEDLTPPPITNRLKGLADAIEKEEQQKRWKDLKKEFKDPEPQSRRPAAPDNSLYSVLEVYFDATTEEITKAFRKKARLYHPDTSRSPNTEMFQKSLSAYQVLKDPERRKRYDAMLRLTNQLSYDNSTEEDSSGFGSRFRYPF